MKILFLILIISFFSCNTKNISVSKEEMVYEVIKIENFGNECKIFVETKNKKNKYHKKITFIIDCKLNLNVGDELFFTPIVVTQ